VLSLLIEDNSVIKQGDKRYGDTEVRSDRFVTSVTTKYFVLGESENAAT